MSQIIARHGFFRFTKSQNLLSMPLTKAEAGSANTLTIKTGGDDLRGDNDDLNVVVFFALVNARWRVTSTAAKHGRTDRLTSKRSR